MKRFRVLFCAAMLSSAATVALPLAAGAQIQTGTLITLADGQVQGHVNGLTREFLGIPYAEPPVGSLRWRPPTPNAPWSGVLTAATFPPACAQLDSLTSDASESEDCLYLNVWTPNPAPAAPLPVMVWIHGGGNVVGSTGDLVPFPPYETYHLYDAHNLSGNQNVVVVSMNYRVGVFGFFGLSELADEDSQFPYAGNQGLLDQRLAMQWVHDNITAFGGDPNNVTIFGESAGSFNVCAHVVSPMSNGLFHRAISESGGCTVNIATADESNTRATDVAAAVGCDAAPDVLACLRSVPVDELLNAYGPFGLGNGPTIAIDGGFLPDHPRALFDSDNFAHVPYILGANSDEGTLFFIGSTPITTAAEYTAELTSRFGATLAPQIEALYPVGSFATPQDALIRVVGDAALVCSTYDVARRVSRVRHSPRTYVYNFSHVIQLPFVVFLNLGAFHGSEIAYVFGSLPPPGVWDQALGEHMQEYWSRFAAKGRPKSAHSKGWPRFKERSWQMLRLDAFTTSLQISRIRDFRRPQCEFWSQAYETIN